MHPTYATKLGFCARKIDVSTQKIESSYLDTFGMVIADCLVKNNVKKARFFQEPFCWLILALKESWGSFSPPSAKRKYNLWSGS